MRNHIARTKMVPGARIVHVATGNTGTVLSRDARLRNGKRRVGSVIRWDASGRTTFLADLTLRTNATAYRLTQVPAAERLFSEFVRESIKGLYLLISIRELTEFIDNQTVLTDDVTDEDLTFSPADLPAGGAQPSDYSQTKDMCVIRLSRLSILLGLQRAGTI